MARKHKLGSGLFDFTPATASPFALGSGLFGQQLPQQQAQAAPAGAGWTSAEGGQGYANGMAMDVGAPRQTQAQAESGTSFDDRIGGLLASPAFQLGTNLLGASNSANPWGTALNNTLAAQAQSLSAKRGMRAQDIDEKRLAMQEANATHDYELGTRTADTNARNADIAGRRADLEGRQLDAQMPLWQAQAGNYQAQAGLRGQELDLDRRQFEQQQLLMQQLMGSMGGGLFGGNTAPQAPKAPTGAGTGKYGTPGWLLDNLSHVESGGNPNAVNPQSGATGEFQFMPGTVDMLHKQGVQFDPRDPQGSRDAADYYLQQLLKQSGGNYQQALAAYGGFKTKDPTPYVNKVLKGAPTPVLEQAQGTAPNEANALALARLGAVASVGGMKGGAQVMDLAKMSQPQSQPAGSYLRDPNSGGMTFVPDPYKEADAQRANATLAQQTPAPGAPAPAGVSPRDASQMWQSSMTRQVEDLTKDYNDKIKRVPESLMAIQKARDVLPQAVPFVGSMGEKKLAAAKFLGNTFGINVAPEAVRSAETLRSALFLPILDNLKQLDAQPTEQQQATLQKAMGSLGTDPSALPAILDIMEDRLKYRVETHNRNFSEAKARGAPFAADLTVKVPERVKSGASAEAPMTADEWLSQHRPKRTDTPVSPREATGKIR